MDLVLNACDSMFLDSLWSGIAPLAAVGVSQPPLLPLSLSPSVGCSWTNETTCAPLARSAATTLATSWPRDYLPRQIASITLITLIGAYALYLIFATINYYLLFDHKLMKHPKFLKNQVRQELHLSLTAIPVMVVLTVPWFLAEVRGYSQLYEGVDEYGWGWLLVSIVLYLCFTDFLDYWLHRFLHHPLLYKHLHKPHHRFIIPTPFASHAFHPLDGYIQGLPYHAFVFIFPLHRKVYLGLFIFVNLWTIFIHDSDMITGHFLESFINGPSHHTLHHLYFTSNYGQYFTWMDKTGGTYKATAPHLDPMLEVLALEDKHKAE